MFRSLTRLDLQNLFQIITLRNFHISPTSFIFWQKLKKRSEEGRLIEEAKSEKVSADVFALSEHKIKEMDMQKKTESIDFMKKLIFEEAIMIYMQQYGKTRRGHVQFIHACLKKMKEYNVHKSLSTYKKILEIFPEVKMIPKTFWQTELFHYPRQQDCAISILIAMENNAVIPDDHFGQLIYKRFGLHTSPMVRYQRMMYWQPKLKNANPWPVPLLLPNDMAEIARLALIRLNPEKETKVELVEVELNEYEKTWIAHAQSDVQKKLIVYLKHSFASSNVKGNSDTERVLYVDGPNTVWIRDKLLNYYMLNTELDKDRMVHHQYFYQSQDKSDEGKFDRWYSAFDPNTQLPVYFGQCQANEMLPSTLTRYEDDLDNRTVLATCMIGNESIAGLRLWINMLIQDNPELNNFKIVFRLSSRPGELVA